MKFNIGADAERNPGSVKTVVGIDLFARRCIEGVQLTMAARPVTQPPHLAQRQPPGWAGFGVPLAVRSATVQKGFSAMNFRILAAATWPHKRVLALLAATALTATCLIPDAKAQTATPAPGAPAAAPKAA